jgi:hypothetical protein
LCHAAGRKPLLKAPSDFFTRQMMEAIHSADPAVDILNDKAGETILNYFRLRALSHRIRERHISM